jgi:hypothetical protein
MYDIIASFTFRWKELTAVVSQLIYLVAAQGQPVPTTGESQLILSLISN